MVRIVHFKSKEAYRKWLAYKNMHGLKHGVHYENVKLDGRDHHVVHKVKHSSGRKSYMHPLHAQLLDLRNR